MSAPDWVLQLDETDALSGLRSNFLIEKEFVYLDGNSLGPVCKSAQTALNDAQTQWQQDLIKSWNQHQWIDLPLKVGAQIAPLIGAAPGQTICCDSISVNLFKLLAAALNMQPGRTVIVSERDNFPTDLYMVEGLNQLLGDGAVTLKLCDAHELAAAMDESVAVLLLTEVNFRTGARHDMAALNQLAHDKGILTIWDLAHSAGAIKVELDKWQTDFAVGCGYKYLNGGPGSPAFIYAAERHHDRLRQPLSGWMGHKTPFEFSPHYKAAAGISCFLAGTPPILSMACLSGALDVFEHCDIEQLETKAKQLMQTFLKGLGDLTLELITPIKGRYGNQLSFTHNHAYAICQCLIERNIIADFRAPNILRLGFSPSFLSHAQVWQAAEYLVQILKDKTYTHARFQIRNKVT